MTVTGGALDVLVGPFAETKEMISYALYQVRTKAEATEWTTRFMKVHRDLWPGWEGEAEVPPRVRPRGLQSGRVTPPGTGARNSADGGAVTVTRSPPRSNDIRHACRCVRPAPALSNSGSFRIG